MVMRTNGEQLGYIPAHVVASGLANNIDSGLGITCRISSLTGGGEKWRGVNIEVEVRDAAEAVRAHGRAVALVSKQEVNNCMFCSNCGLESGAIAKFCSRCGEPVQIMAADKGQVHSRKRSGPGGILLVIAGVCVLIIVIALMAGGDTRSPAPAKQAVATRLHDTYNPANDKLQGLSEPMQATALGAIVNEGCAGSSAFYMGSHPKDHSAFWSVGCRNGRKYEVEVEADRTGSTKILDCDMLVLAKLKCFVRLDQQ